MYGVRYMYYVHAWNGLLGTGPVWLRGVVNSRARGDMHVRAESMSFEGWIEERGGFDFGGW